MVSAILYTSAAGHTKAFAELLAAKTGLPAYNVKTGVPADLRGKDVIFMGWLMAGGVTGLGKALRDYGVKAVCAVGMAPKEQDQTAGIQKKYGLTVPLFYLQGGFAMDRTSGIYKFMMRVMCKKIQNDMGKLENPTPEQQLLLKMTKEGFDAVSEAQLADVLRWYEGNK